VFEKGETLRFDDFAARAGVGVGTLYRHFPTREALAAAVYSEEVSALCTGARDSQGPALEALATFLRTFVSYLAEHGALARTLSGIVDPATQSAAGRDLERTVGELLARAVTEGAVNADVQLGAVMIVLHGIGSSSGRPEWASEANNAVEVVLRGLAVASRDD